MNETVKKDGVGAEEKNRHASKRSHDELSRKTYAAEQDNDPDVANKRDSSKGQDSKCDGNKSSSSSDPGTSNIVHSYNDWEHAEFGDDAKKQKFLRLMGAAKGKPSDKIVTEDVPEPGKQRRDPEADRKLEKNLEQQFVTSMSNKLKQRDRHHRGLGWHGDTQPSLSDSAISIETPQSDDAPDSDQSVNKPTQPSTIQNPPPKTLPSGGIKFVAGSSD